MSPERHHDDSADEGGLLVLEELLETELGEPVESYETPLDESVKKDLDSRLEDVQRAHAYAAAMLPTLYAD